MAIAVQELLPRPDAAARPVAQQLQDYGLFDVLRFSLASVVVLGHIGLITWGPAGNLAVQVFFSLSGWLIGGILCRTTGSALPRFYFNRSTRIWIPYFFSVAVLYAVSYVHEPIRSSRWPEFLAYDVTFTHNWFALWPHPAAALAAMPLKGTGNHFWSLAVEEQFYLVCPLVMLLPFGKRWGLWAAIALVACASGYYYGSVALGVLSAVLAYRYPGWQYKPIAMIALAALLGISLTTLIQPSAYEYAAPFFAVSLILLCARRTKRIPLGRALGGISFPLYLNAWMGIFVIHAVEKKIHLRESMLLEFLGALAAGTVCYFMIDVPIMANRGRYFRPALGLACGIVGYMLVTAGVLFFVTLHR